MWTPTPPLLGRRTPRPGPARVCLCILFLAGSGGPASWARFGAPQLSLSRFVLLLCSAPSGLGLPVLEFCFFLFFCVPLCPLSLSPLAPLLSPAFCALRPWVPCPWRPSFAPAPPPFLFFFVILSPFSSCVSRPLVLRAPPLAGCGDLLFPAACVPGLGVARFAPPPFFSSHPPPPPPVPFASMCWRVLLPAAVLCAVCALGCFAVPPLPSRLCGMLCCLCWSDALAVRSRVLRCFLWCSAVWCVLCCCAPCRVLVRPVVLCCGASCALLRCAMPARLCFAPACLLAVLAACAPPPLECALCLLLSGVAVLCCPSVWCFAVPCCRVPCSVLWCGVPPCLVVGCSALCGALCAAPWVAAAC